MQYLRIASLFMILWTLYRYAHSFIFFKSLYIYPIFNAYCLKPIVVFRCALGLQVSGLKSRFDMKSY
ncbi:hypothetical protein BDP27DRAFT_1317745 [Rhodocollybia butyracea]|uniref:Uncharacterized protein n=1 Tax=Rhodocollybia butyracea TaxID=206335 RepID=A0A9P5Q1V9_9AGAR|nr:hypothetical protein BDP27DRAFT_1317745 [Rhodocollybia butyracea]